MLVVLEPLGPVVLPPGGAEGHHLRLLSVEPLPGRVPGHGYKIFINFKNG